MTETPQTPLAILLAAMHRKWQEGDIDAAAALARSAAPYIHARRAPIREDLSPGRTDEMHRLTDAQLESLLGTPDRGRGGNSPS